MLNVFCADCNISKNTVIKEEHKRVVSLWGRKKTKNKPVLCLLLSETSTRAFVRRSPVTDPLRMLTHAQPFSYGRNKTSKIESPEDPPYAFLPTPACFLLPLRLLEQPVEKGDAVGSSSAAAAAASGRLRAGRSSYYWGPQKTSEFKIKCVEMIFLLISFGETH